MHIRKLLNGLEKTQCLYWSEKAMKHIRRCHDRRDMTLAFNPFPNDKFQNLPNWKFANDNSKFDKNDRNFSKWVEITVGKGEMAPFPTVFSKDVYCWTFLGKD